MGASFPAMRRRPRQRWRAVLAVAIAQFTAGLPAPAGDPTSPRSPEGGSPVVPLSRAHSHNDYEHDRPLDDALSHGFCSVEADIFLVDGALLVAHDIEDVQPGRTLESLYLDPLRRRMREHGGRVHPEGPSFLLLIDIKSDGEATYRALADRLRAYRDLVDGGAVRVVVSGNRAKDAIAADPDRLAGIDGRLADLGRESDADIFPLISDRWSDHFRWNGEGEMPAGERERLASIVDAVHAGGQRIRFWATPETVAMWRELAVAGVDLINTDDLAGLAGFLRRFEADQRPPGPGAVPRD